MFLKALLVIRCAARAEKHLSKGYSKRRKRMHPVNLRPAFCSRILICVTVVKSYLSVNGLSVMRINYGPVRDAGKVFLTNGSGIAGRFFTN